jgi:hypothetical protein
VKCALVSTLCTLIVRRRMGERGSAESLQHSPHWRHKVTAQLLRASDAIHLGCLVFVSVGAERHYTHSYATFLAKLKAEPDFACWLQAIETDLAALLTGPSWMGESNLTPHRCVYVVLLVKRVYRQVELLILSSG